MVVITPDESTFNTNVGKRRIWIEEGKNPLRPQAWGKEIMVSGFLTPGGILRVLDHIPDAESLLNPTWPLLDGIPIRDAMEYLIYGQNK